MSVPSPSRLALSTAAVALVLSAAGCGASLPTSAEAAAAETADEVCAMLRELNNEMAVSLNATSDEITDADDPETAPQVLRDGYDDLIGIAEDYAHDVDELDLPVSDARDALLGELHSGAEEAVTALEDERTELEGLDPVEVDDQAGVLGGAFTSLEKAQSVVEPRIGAYGDEELTEAFAAEPTCEHFIQPS
jgi:hypothetical protein